MPGKRSKHKNVQRFYCPYCERRLWRLGSPKHYLFYLGASQIKENVNMSRKSAEILASKGAYIDSNSWIEDFFCGEHGKLWMKLTRKADGKFGVALATSKDWPQTTRTILPDTPNPSVSEFTYRISRQSGIKAIYSKE
jgi:hypothetical protein